ncbi:hypothetical protein F2Q68_00025382 [Brassica cretica]|uniref:Uncharacterized protein n=1 Tax=Brassica cretica TaxID=69181 RepID=A0A8S9IJ04_BRACR|nr:hypothetical protein F2Q68_00025382 [Brassica cretica]
MRVPNLRGSFPWARLDSGPLFSGGLYLDWGQGPTPSTAFGDRIDSLPSPGVESSFPPLLLINTSISPKFHEDLPAGAVVVAGGQIAGETQFELLIVHFWSEVELKSEGSY